MGYQKINTSLYWQRKFSLIPCQEFHVMRDHMNIKILAADVLISLSQLKHVYYPRQVTGEIEEYVDLVAHFPKYDHIHKSSLKVIIESCEILELRQARENKSLRHDPQLKIIDVELDWELVLLVNVQV